jgi:hypothetical protein
MTSGLRQLNHNISQQEVGLMGGTKIELELDEMLAKTIEDRAREHGVSQADYLRKAIDLLNGFDVSLFKQIEAYAARFDIASWSVIQNIIIKRFALDAAESDVLGDNTTLLREFCQTDEGPIDTNDLYNMLKQTYVHDLEMKRFERIMEFKANDWELSEEDLCFLEQYQDRNK